jgi:anaerobic ribonucleoside-triphosphate reductase
MKKLLRSSKVTTTILDDGRGYVVNGIDTHNCCRLRLDLREIRKNITGGLFGAAENTGSVGVVTINLPRIGYLARDEEDFFARIDNIMDISAESLDIKRKFVEKMLEAGMYPYTKRYLGTLNNHFSTIGIVGMNECCLNFLGKDISTDEGQEFAVKVLTYMRERLSDYQEKTGALYNIESTPAESTCRSGDTVIKTIDGNKTQRQIYEDYQNGIENFVFSLNEETKEVEVDKVTDCWITNDAADVVKITFDNGQSEVVTPNETFYIRQKIKNKVVYEYKRADELQPNDHIVSAYSRTWQYGKYDTYGKTPIHHAVAKYFYGPIPKGHVVHHIDGNRSNNSKSNIVVLSDADHRRVHMKDTVNKPDKDISGEKNPFFGKHHTEETKAANSAWHTNNEEWHKNLLAAMKRPEVKVKQSESAHNKPREKHSRFRHDVDESKILTLYENGCTVNQIEQETGYTRSIIFSRLKHHGIDTKTRVNHTVVKVERMTDKIPVYDMTIEKNHNVFIGGDSGVLVHNCYRLAKHDVERYPGIIHAGKSATPYYTNSSNLPVGFSSDPWTAIRLQEKLQSIYTGGCVTLDTEIEVEGYIKLSMKDLFKKFTYTTDDMKINVPYDVSEYNLRLCAYDHKCETNVNKQIQKIVYKGDHEVWEAKSSNGDVLLRGKSDHRIYDAIKKDYVFLSDVNDGVALKKDGSTISFTVTNTKKIEPIVDVQIDGGNYFSNEVLSHNTVFHAYLSEAIDDPQKVKEFLKNVIENSTLPYITITPTFSVCTHGHGYLKGDTGGVCPICKAEMLKEYESKLKDLKSKKDMLHKPTNEPSQG